MERIVLERVDSLTDTPAALRRYSCLCLSFANGRSSTSASSSFLAFSPCLLIERGLLARSLPRGQRTPLAHRLHVTLDRGEANPENASDLALVHAAPLHGLDYLPSEIFRISVHHPMMSHGPSSLQMALAVLC